MVELEEPHQHLTVIPRDQHTISRSDISDNALKVLYRLNKAGYEAYLVGGGVRDLLLGKSRRILISPLTPHPIRCASCSATAAWLDVVSVSPILCSGQR